MKPSVAVIIVNYNGVEYIEPAIRSATEQRYDGDVEVIVVDNASADASLALLRAHPGIRLIENSVNGGYGAGANVAIRATKSEYVAFLNPDAVAAHEWLDRVVPWMQEKEIDLASSIIGAGSSTWFAGGRFVETLGATLVGRTTTCSTDWLSGCGLLASRVAVETLGGFDEGFFLYYEDVDLSLRARKARLQLGVFAETLVDHPEHGRSTNALGIRKAQIGFYSRGRLIAKHVRGWRRLPALAFSACVSPLLNGVGIRHAPNVARYLIDGFRSASRARTTW